MGERRIVEFLRQHLVGCDARHILPYVIVCAYGCAIVQVVARVLLRKLAKSDMTRQVHTQLAACEATVHDVIGVRVGLDDRRKHVLAFIQMLGDAPLLETKDEHTGYRLSKLLVLDDVYAGPVFARNRRTRH